MQPQKEIISERRSPLPAKSSIVPVSRRSGPSRELTWVDIVGRYAMSRECLAAFIVTSTAEVLAGVKPANLIRILKRSLPCGRCMYALWKEHGTDILTTSSLQVLTVRSDADGDTLLFYRRDLLEKRLSGRTMQSFLKRHGYPQPMTVDNILSHLQQNFRCQESPDEVGMFLGYPLRDVNGFMARRQNAWQGRCLWRIYGPPERSLRLYHAFCHVRRELNQCLTSGIRPATLLEAC